jgi:hydroxymethylpyrimidine pyrophosphatase-like HAD family hydrolase
LRFSALALDYDGTLASHDRIESPSIDALERARQAGLRLILVTGRTFFELIRVCTRIDLFDAVVAENGAVLYFPAQGTVVDEAPPPPPRLLAELDRRSIPLQIGRVIIGTAQSFESEVLAALAASAMHLDLVRNRAALMLLPAGISKGSGVRRAIGRLGLSFHDVLAIGDAENDLDLFAACGFAACPGNAVAELMTAADWTLPGENGTAIAHAIMGPILSGTLPTPRSARQRIDLGWTPRTTERVTIPAHGVNVLVQGDSISGKSWLAGGVAERLIARDYATCVIDPEGDYQALAGISGVRWMEARDGDVWKDVVDAFQREPGACVIVDLSALRHEGKRAVIQAGLAAIRELRRRVGRPHWVLLDEAHYSLHREGIPDDVAGLEEKGFWLITYRASWLRPSVLSAIDHFIFGRTTAATELAFLRSFMERGRPGSVGVVGALPDLAPPEFVLVSAAPGPDAGAVTFVAPPRLTQHVRHVGKYWDQPVADDKAFFFRGPDGRLLGTADTLRALLERLEDVDGEVLAYHASRGDLSRWLADVFLDRHLGNQVRKLEQRWSRDDVPELRQGLVRLLSTALDEGKGPGVTRP